MSTQGDIEGRIQEKNLNGKGNLAAAINGGGSLVLLILGSKMLEVGIMRADAIINAVYAANSYILTSEVIKQAQSLATAQTWDDTFYGGSVLILGGINAAFAIYNYNRNK